MTKSSENRDALTYQMRAAIGMWEHLAAYAWEQTLTFGRGVVLVNESELMAAAACNANDEPFELPLGFVPMLEVPSGDDFLQIIASYDVERQVLLLVGQSGTQGAEDDEQLIVLEASEHGRPVPRECFYARTKSD